MKKKAVVLIILCIILVGVGDCQKEQEQKESKATSTLMPTATPVAVPEDFSHIEKHLVWYHDEMIKLGTDPGVFNAFNRLLLERGYDFVVDFVTAPTLTEGQYRTYQQRMDIFEGGVEREENRFYNDFGNLLFDRL